MGRIIECADGEDRFFGLPGEGDGARGDVDAEGRYGSTYDDAGAAHRQHLKCVTVGCERARPESPPIAVHEDTVQPVFCGGCGAVLLCEHTEAARPVERLTGTVVEPVLVRAWPCRKCGAVMRSERVAKQALRLDDLPVEAMAGLGLTLEDRP